MEQNSSIEDPPFDFGRLRRFPDVEAPNLFAHDATDELILREASGALSAHDGGRVAIVGDRYGALTLAAATLHGLSGLRVHQDGRSGELALAANAARLGLEGSYSSMPLDAGLVRDAAVVLWQLPRSLEEVAEVAQLISAHASPEVRIFAGGRIKHMTVAMNAVLSQYFSSVIPGRAWRKSRPLVVGEPLATGQRGEGPASDFPKKEYHADLGLWLCAHGATFGGTKVDVGTRFLLGFVDQMRPGAAAAVDLGCGNGTIAAALAKARPALRVTATDQSAAAVAATMETAAANGLADRIDTVRDDALDSFAPASAELIVLNPPFHVGAAVHAGIAHKLFAAAARVLAPGGELWCVYNRHLDYKDALARTVGETSVMGRNSKFTVTKSTKTL
ncbi:16S rRNA (guanine1207-N2)-methyltransferase [Arthrobacter stackebrandtii]|uniref:16S rRNA (Guanine1207-N2)-methyltransferase n=1 Tax=Arthrobacter stackebrandtii TaxID=272161 RepID=A0ABS4YZZ7_9MICC|nr:16S rRNA (guanine1207-N2)-methyltransferase [Arthrobacter stackebrandtii]PYH01472.1 SAM-dependent methyltransferase [Arthrobacter stackebrandtii]